MPRLGTGRWLTVKSICCSYKGLKFSSQYLHGGSYPSIPLVPGDLTPLPLQALHTPYVYTHMQTKHSYKKRCVILKIIKTFFSLFNFTRYRQFV